MVFLDYWPNHIISQSWAMSYKPFPCIFVGYNTVQYIISTMNPQWWWGHCEVAKQQTATSNTMNTTRHCIAFPICCGFWGIQIHWGIAQNHTPKNDEQNVSKNVRVAWAYWYPIVGGISLAIASASLGTCKSSRRLCSIPDTKGVTPCCSKQGSINASWTDLRGKNGNTSSSDSINSPGNQPPMVPSIALRVFSVLVYRQQSLVLQYAATPKKD